MQPGHNTTYVHYHLQRGSGPFELYLKAMVNYRDYHRTTILNDWTPAIDEIDNGLRIVVFDGATPLYLLHSGGQVWPDNTWYEDYLLSIEEYRGQNDVVEDHIHVGVFGNTLHPGDSFTLVASTEAAPVRDGELAFHKRRDHERRLLMRAATVPVPSRPRNWCWLPTNLSCAVPPRTIRRDAPSLLATRGSATGVGTR
jgi:hypothetical protein